MPDKEIETASLSIRRPASVRAQALRVLRGTERTNDEARRERLRKLEAPYRSDDTGGDEAA